jgi:sulfofructose kinase
MNPITVDVLCVGQATYDLIFSVQKHPAENEKMFADSALSCGGGPAANAAVMVTKLGLTAAFAGYLGRDGYGEQHLQELLSYKVNTLLIVRGDCATPLSTVLVKPNGDRALINYKEPKQALAVDSIDFSAIEPKVVLFDGHEPLISTALIEQTRQRGIVSVLDAGSVHDGTLALMASVDYLVCSEKFALQYAGDEQIAIARLAQFSPAVVITLGERGVIWQRGTETGSLPAFAVNAIDSTGAGDAFHGAFASGLALNLAWQDLLSYASAAGSLCCTRMGARLGLPSQAEHEALWLGIK